MHGCLLNTVALLFFPTLKMLELGYAQTLSSVLFPWCFFGFNTLSYWTHVYYTRIIENVGEFCIFFMNVACNVT